MPTYEYACEACGHNFSAKQRMTEARLVDCPACGKASLHRVIGAAGFALKGGGWYQTDFKPAQKAAETPSACDKPACTGGVCAAGA